MFPSTRSLSGRLLTTAAAAAALAAVAAGPADAAPTKLPTVVDGVRYSPTQMHRFGDQPLYGRVSDDGKTLVGYTQLRDYKRALKRRGLRLPTTAQPAKPQARQSARYDYATICTDNFLRGTCRNVDSGWGLASMSAYCEVFGCLEFDNAVSSIETHGAPVVLFDNVGFNIAGCTCHFNWATVTIPAYKQIDLVTVGFNDRASSMYVYW